VIGPKQHRGGGECALCDAHAKASDRHTAPARARSRRLVPWIAPLLVSAGIVPFVGQPGPWVALGLSLGLAAGALLAWRADQTNARLAAGALHVATEELKSESEQRVAMVIRQFEWAVNDVANLRDALKRAQDARATSEANEHRVRRRLHKLERQLYDARMKIGEYSRALGSNDQPAEEPVVLPSGDELVVPLTWVVFQENMLRWLRFESAGIVPSQIRILNEHDSVIAISAHALDTIEEGAQVALLLRAPDDVVAKLEGRYNGEFKFEALVDDAWCGVDLRPGHVEPKEARSRTWRPDDDHRPQALIA
jgi:hypothetical protein